MKVKVIEDSESILVLEISKIDNSIVNAIRRIAIAETPTFAIDTVDIHVNEGILNNEYVAHRLGLCVLKVTGELKEDIIGTDFVCEEEKEYVYLKDFDFPENVEPVYPDTKITVLTKGQSFKVEAKIAENCGLEHAKWSPVCPCFFNKIGEQVYRLTIESTGGLTPKEIYKKSLEILENKLENLENQEPTTRENLNEKVKIYFYFFIINVGNISRIGD